MWQQVVRSAMRVVYFCIIEYLSPPDSQLQVSYVHICSKRYAPTRNANETNLLCLLWRACVRANRAIIKTNPHKIRTSWVLCAKKSVSLVYNFEDIDRADAGVINTDGSCSTHLLNIVFLCQCASDHCAL
jgi:hypothetical protein